MIDLGAVGQATNSSRVWMLPATAPDGGLQSELTPGRVLVVRVIEVQGNQAVLAWGHHRLPVRTQPPLNPGSTLTLQVQEASDRRLALRLLQADGGEGSGRADPRGQRLAALGLPDDARNRAIVDGLIRAGRPVTAAEVQAVRQGLAQLAAQDDATSALIWLRSRDLPLSQRALELGRAFLAHQPNTGTLWQIVLTRLMALGVDDRKYARLAAQLPVVSLDEGEGETLATRLARAISELVTPPERKLAAGENVGGDARLLLQQVRTAVRLDGRDEPELDQASRALQGRIEAQQVGNTARDGGVRIELPIWVDGQRDVASVQITWEGARRDQADQDPSNGRLTMQLDLSRLGPIVVEVTNRDDGLWCWVSAEHERAYQLLREQSSELARRLADVTGKATKVNCHLAQRASETPASLVPVDVRT